ncbi:hypothetical protein K488DRAFT_85486 [Vararia minispora EC-137]|uniref:Uncharacterized protein n=1 Tax=Vararia minispora EC-137 TaxID=1314806 RepID=A0ACB8QMC1_9AGAM|nr:hypothetical protein K488DRAFT_85486 [Vararia minispora EC-137]
MEHPKTKPKPKFNVAFAHLEDKRPASAARSSIELSSESDVDLPDVHDLVFAGTSQTLKAKRAVSSSSTSYGDSDLDELIRQVPLNDEIIDLTHSPVKTPPTRAAPSSDRPLSSPRRQPQYSPEPTKETSGLSDSCLPRPKKRVRYLSASGGDTSPRGCHPSDSTRLPLFFPASPKSDVPAGSGPQSTLPAPADDAGDGNTFVLDESLFDFVDNKGTGDSAHLDDLSRGPILSTSLFAALPKSPSPASVTVTPSFLENAFYARRNALSGYHRHDTTSGSSHYSLSNESKLRALPEIEVERREANDLAELEEWLATTDEIEWI